MLPQLPDIDLVLTDPPYGVGERTDRLSKGRTNLARANDFAPIHGDNEPFDPAHLLTFPRVVLFGANYYADRLPVTGSWLVWDKLDGLTTDKRLVGFDDNADLEMAWTNLGGPARLIRHRWKGMVKGSEQGASRIHPTQKPIALMARIIAWQTEPWMRILDPYMGSGSTLRAAKDHGRAAIGIEIEERYCQASAERCAQEVLAV